jgi:hypothetical protein
VHLSLCKRSMTAANYLGRVTPFPLFISASFENDQLS